MRNYFSFDMKGGKVFLPFLAGWIFLMVIEVLFGWLIAPHLAPDVPLNGKFLLWALYGMLLFLGALIATLWVLFYFVKFTVSSVSLSSERFDAYYEMGPYMRLCLKDALLATITFGVYLPWLAADVIRYFAAETSFRSNALEFRGRASTLFIYMALFVVAPVFVFVRVLMTIYGGVVSAEAGAVLLYVAMWAILILSISVYRAVSIKWFINFVYGGRKKIMSEVRGWNAGTFIFRQYLLCGVTLGLYYPMALLRIWKYYVGGLVLGAETVEDNFGFTMRPGANYLIILGQMLLTIVTLGIYYPWAYARVLRLLVSQSYVEMREDGNSVPMPADYQ